LDRTCAECGGREIQERVGTKYATFRVFAIDGIEAK
jgi:hypothetical protein